jgi:hypothetical protein
MFQLCGYLSWENVRKRAIGKISTKSRDSEHGDVFQKHPFVAHEADRIDVSVSWSVLIKKNLHPKFVSFILILKGNGKANPLQGWAGPESSSRMKLLDFKKMAHESGKVISPTHRPPLPPRIIPGTHFC